MTLSTMVDAVYHRAIRIDPAMWAGLAAADRRIRIRSLVREGAPLSSLTQVESVVDRVLARVGGLGPLEPLLGDGAVTEVMVNGDGRVFVERAGRIEATPLVLDEGLVLHLIERIVAPLGLRVDRSSPTVDARLPDGSRVNAIVRPVAVDGPCLTIRRFGVRRVGLSEFASTDVVDLLRWAVAARCNIVVSGGTGSGKTTLLNALTALIPPGERLVTIEDTAELRVAPDHVVRLEAKPPNADGQGGLPVRELVRNALRMRPDRIVVGEVRGAEALDMLQAMNTGHEGSLSTCHANSPPDALRRIETMVLMGADAVPLPAIREQIRSSVDLLVQVTRDLDGTRCIDEVHEVGSAPGEGDTLTTTCLAERGQILASPSRFVREPSAGTCPIVPRDIAEAR